MSKKKEELFQKYLELTKKLNKFPSWRDCKKFNISHDAIYYHYDNLTNLKKAIAEEHPDVAQSLVPVQLNITDIEGLRIEDVKKTTKLNNKILVENVNTLDFISQFADNVFAGKVTAKPMKKLKKIKRVHTLVLSDLHFGADISSDETGVANYGTIEEARRFASIIREAAQYKPQYRKETKLVIILCGDIIENSMHDPRTGEVISIQVCRAIHLLLQGIAYLSNFYHEISVECATGNHDRITSRHKDRAVHQKFDSFSTIIYYALKSGLKNIKHVTVNIPKQPLAYYEVFGRRIAYTHGDTVIKTGGIYSTVNVKGLEAQVNKINAALPDKEEYAAIVYGHCLTDEHTVNVKHKGWVNISEVQPGDVVLSYNPKEQRNEWTQVQDTVNTLYSGDLLTVGSRFWTQTMTSNHHMMTKDGRYVNIVDLMAQETPNSVPLNTGSVVSNDQGLDMGDNLLRIIVAVCADAHIDKNGNLRFHLNKPRKLQRLKYLLDTLGYSAVYRIQKTGNTKVSIDKKSDLYKEIIKWVNPKDKRLPNSFFQLSTKQKETLIEEVTHWDGCYLTYTHYQFSSRKQDELDMIQSILNELGYKSSRKGVTVSFNLNRNVDRFNNKSWKLSTNLVKNYPVYCLTTKFQNFWVRHEPSGTVSLTGNTHIAHTIKLSNGCVLIGNGALPPPDAFAVSIGTFESNNSQWIFESVPGHPVGDMRAITTGKQYDKDESLDEIIKPWKGF